MSPLNNIGSVDPIMAGLDALEAKKPEAKKNVEEDPVLAGLMSLENNIQSKTKAVADKKDPILSGLKDLETKKQEVKHFGEDANKISQDLSETWSQYFIAAPIAASEFVDSVTLGYTDFADDMVEKYKQEGYDTETALIGVSRFIGDVGGMLIPGLGSYKLVGMGAKLGAKALVKTLGKGAVKAAAGSVAKKSALKGLAAAALKEGAIAGTAEAAYGAAINPEEGQTRTSNALMMGLGGFAAGGIFHIGTPYAVDVFKKGGKAAEELVDSMSKKIAYTRKTGFSQAKENVKTSLENLAKSGNLEPSNVVKVFDDNLEDIMRRNPLTQDEIQKTTDVLSKDPAFKRIFKEETKDVPFRQETDVFSESQIVPKTQKEKTGRLVADKLSDQDKAFLDDKFTQYFDEMATETGPSYIGRTKIQHIPDSMKKFKQDDRAIMSKIKRNLPGFVTAGEKLTTFGAAGARTANILNDKEFLVRKVFGEFLKKDTVKSMAKHKKNFNVIYDALEGNTEALNTITNSKARGEARKLVTDLSDAFKSAGTEFSNVGLTIDGKKWTNELVEGLSEKGYAPRTWSNKTKLEFMSLKDPKSRNAMLDGLEQKEFIKNRVEAEEWLDSWLASSASPGKVRNTLEKYLVKKGKVNSRKEARQYIFEQKSHDIDNYAKNLIKNGEFNNIEDAKEFIRNSKDLQTAQVSDIDFTPDVLSHKKFTGAETSRKLDLGGYDKTPDAIIDYFLKASDRVADARLYGKNKEIVNKLYDSMKNYDSKAKSTMFLKYVRDNMIGEPIESKTSRDLRHLMTGTKLTPFTTLLNATQKLNIIPRASAKSLVKAEAKNIARSREAEKLAWETGSGVRSFMQKAQMLDDSSGSLASKFAEKSMKSILFPFVESNNRKISALAGREWAKDLSSTLINSVDGVGRKADRQYKISYKLLDELGVNVEGVIRSGKLSPNDLKNAALTIEKDTQFFSRLVDLPAFVHKFKLQTQFMGAATQQFDLAAKYVLKEAVTSGRIMPLIQFSILNEMAGTGIAASRDIPARLQGKSKKDLNDYLLEGIGRGPGFGIAYDIYSTIGSSKQWQSKRLAGPAFATGLELIEAAKDIKKGKTAKATQTAIKTLTPGIVSGIVPQFIETDKRKRKR